ncbi:NusG domain II-containing protein [Anaerophilus nitritogenes]|uniref:NusG domain II-containing protein n=1 Tax=Anaerophilus nitritogenes TaxID=2498136 RepID=UPI00101C2860|nr:NusG domain II-containing protein [Anaerophilus nitritogenes]
MIKNMCPRSICSEIGWIDKKYQSIVCMPNKIVVAFEQKQKQKEEIDIILY